LEPFNQNAICIKCGYNEISLQYIKNIDYDCSSNYNCGPVNLTDHFHRNCMRCGYKWPEMVLNLTQPQPAKKDQVLEFGASPPLEKEPAGKETYGLLGQYPEGAVTLTDGTTDPNHQGEIKPVKQALDSLLTDQDILHERAYHAEKFEERETAYREWAERQPVEIESDREAALKKLRA
jgi:hypothetical protein